jgi:hypothetical protein
MPCAIMHSLKNLVYPLEYLAITMHPYRVHRIPVSAKGKFHVTRLSKQLRVVTEKLLYSVTVIFMGRPTSSIAIVGMRVPGARGCWVLVQLCSNERCLGPQAAGSSIEFATKVVRAPSFRPVAQIDLEVYRGPLCGALPVPRQPLLSVGHGFGFLGLRLDSNGMLPNFARFLQQETWCSFRQKAAPIRLHLLGRP